MAKKWVDNLNEQELDDLLTDILEKRSLEDHVEAITERTDLTMLNEWIEEASELVKNEGKVWGVLTHIRGIDELLCGMKGGDLIVLAGQTSHGKSLVAVNIAYQMAKHGDPVLFTTLEMSHARIASRFISLALQEGVDPLSLEVYFQQASALQYKDIGMLIKRAKQENCKAIIIDHLHFFPRGTSQNMSTEIGRITKHFKEMAVEHDIPIILISHVNRLNDPKARPGLNNLKESGYIEQDADSVLFVWRDLGIDGDSSLVEIYIAKSRNDGFPYGRQRLFRQDKWLLTEINGEVSIPEGW